jgi:hypothetical protein
MVGGLSHPRPRPADASQGTSPAAMEGRGTMRSCLLLGLGTTMHYVDPRSISVEGTYGGSIRSSSHAGVGMQRDGGARVDLGRAVAREKFIQRLA